MGNYTIALSGLSAVQTAFDIIGSNITNAGTDGYHKQTVEFSPTYTSETTAGGVAVTDITRVIDTLLEKELYLENATLAQLSQENTTLTSIETALGELTSDDSGINAAIDALFTAMQDLVASPTDSISLTQLVSDAESLTSQIRTVGEYLTTLEASLASQADTVVDDINTLSEQIAELNNKIEAVQLVGGNSNTLCDQRDEYISELSNLIGVQTVNRDNGVVDVIAGDIPLVIGSHYSEIETGLTEDGELGIALTGGITYDTDIEGGTLGGLLTLTNDSVVNIHNKLDTLATTIIQTVNDYHVQGIGTSGSFTELTGWSNLTDDLNELSGITSGYTYIRVTDTTTGEVTRTAIPVLQSSSSDSLTEIADWITNNVANVSAYVNSSNQLTITSDSGYEYDFIPEVLSEPATTSLASAADAPTIEVSGVYTGSTNETLTFTVEGTGTVGVDDDLYLVVTDSSGQIEKINIGSGYVAGDSISIGTTGIEITLTDDDYTTCDFTDGDSFTVDAYADTDTSGLLSATGINTFFSGDSATTIEVCSEIVDDPSRVATSLTSEGNDGLNITRLYELQDESIEELGNTTISDYYQQLVTEVGQEVSTLTTNMENLEAIVLNLTNQQTEISGVDINEESANLLIYQQLFQSIAKYMETINTVMAELMEVV